MCLLMRRYNDHFTLFHYFIGVLKRKLILLLKAIPFAECMAIVANGEPTITVKSQLIRLDFIAPDLSSCVQIPSRALSEMTKIGEVHIIN